MVLSFAAVAAAAALRLYYGYRLSVSVLSVEGYHALLDAVLSLFVVLALIVSRSSWARRFPYGLYRLEDLAAVALAAVIVVELIDQARGLTEPVPTVPRLVVAVQASTVPLLAASVWFKKRAAVLMRSPGLEADAAHMVVDVAESTAVTAGLVLYDVTGAALAYRASLALALLGLAAAAYEAAHESLLALLDLPRDPSLLEKALEAAKEAAGSRAKITSLRMRWAGPAIFVEVVARIHPLLTVDAASRIAKRIDETLREKLEGVEEVRVVIEPAPRRRLRVAVPVDSSSPGAPVSRHFGKAPFFFIADVDGDKITETRIVRRSELVKGIAASNKMLAGADLAETLHERGVTDVVVRNIGELAYALLLRHKILVWSADPSTTAADNVRKLVHGQLEPLEEPTHEAPWRRVHAGGGRD